MRLRPRSTDEREALGGAFLGILFSVSVVGVGLVSVVADVSPWLPIVVVGVVLFALIPAVVAWARHEGYWHTVSRAFKRRA